jgi:phytoene desaturase
MESRDMSRAIVVGAGLGGLSAAIRLAARGWDVTVLEKNAEPGGRMSTVRSGPYRWDVGPTLIMMPEVLQELFASAGHRLEDHVDLVRVDPSYRVAFGDGGHLDLTGNLPSLLAGVEAVERGGGERLLRFLGVAERLYRHTRRSILERTFDGVRDLGRPDVLLAILRAGPGSSVASVVARHFASEQLRQAFSFQTLYLGTPPARTPAAYVMIPFVEVAMGVWYPRGGVHTIAAAMARVAVRLGVRLHLDTPVRRIVVDGRRAVGVEVEGGEQVRGDAVIANADWGHTQRDLLGDGARVAARDHGCSGVLFLMAVRRRLAGPHHTFLLSRDFAGNLADVFEHRRLPRQPSIYVSRPTATDPSLAPDGVELLYVLVPTPTLESGVDWSVEVPALRARVLDRLAETGLGRFEADVVAEAALTPETFRSRYNLTHGSAFGLAATLLQSGPFRPGVRSPRYAGLYHVGASAHPGGGVPIVTLCGRLAAEAAERDAVRSRRRGVVGGVRTTETEAWSGSALSS